MEQVSKDATWQRAKVTVGIFRFTSTFHFPAFWPCLSWSQFFTGTACESLASNRFKKLRNKASNTSLAQPCNDIYVLSFVLSLHTFPYLSLPYTPIHITPCGCELLLPGYVFSCMALWLRSWIPPGKWTNNKKNWAKNEGKNHRTSRSLGRMMCLYMYDIHNICVRYPCHSDLVQGSTLAGCLFQNLIYNWWIVRLFNSSHLTFGVVGEGWKLQSQLQFCLHVLSVSVNSNHP